MKLIIAEKPSLGMNIASALNITKRNNGYLENNKYIVTWAYGHLFSLYNVNDYIGENKKWHEVPLPYIPKEYRFKLKKDKGIKEQYNIIKKLINDNRVTEIINCGDADREGQVIIDLIINEVNTNKPVKRLWLPEQTEDTIRDEMNNLKDNSYYNNYLQEGLTRTYIDWVLGINLTRYITLKADTLLPVGRVLIPIVKYINDRDLEIQNFKKEKYYILESKSLIENKEVLLSIKDKKYNLNEINQANRYADELNREKAIVKDIEEKEIIKQPGKLFSLSKLQSELSKKYKIDFATSLKYIQNLYEKGYITYPRTNTEYLAENEKDKVKKLIEIFQDEHNIEFKDTKKIFDDTKIESHSAIIVTTKKPKNLEKTEKLIYSVILNRFLSNFLIDKSVIGQVNVKVAVKGELFALKGETLKSEGFYKYEPKNFKNELPNLRIGQTFDVNFKPGEKETSPPKKVTEEELSNYLKNPFRKEINSNEKIEEDYQAILKGIEIGTEATRTGIIENAKKYKYISQDKQNYNIEPIGKNLIKILEQLNINLDKEKNVEISQLQKSVFKNNIKKEEAIEKVEEEVINLINEDTKINIKIDKEEKEIIGLCPLCKRNVYESKSNFYCSGFSDKDKKCNFVLYKNDFYFKNFGKKITKTFARNILKNNKAVMKNLKSKKGNIFNAEFSIKEYKPYIKWDMEFINSKK